MCKHLKTLLVASMLTTALGAAPALYAHGSDGTGMSMMGRGMMGQGGMMGQMSSMMENCNQMMQAMMGGGYEPARPNEQWRGRQAAPQDHPRPQAAHR